MVILPAIPLVAMLAIIVATLVRGSAIRRKTGDRAWAFASAKGVQRIAGSSFAISVTMLLAAAVFAARMEPAGLSLVATVTALIGAAIVIIAQVQMGRAWRVGVRAGDAPLFISHGLFRFSRNPIFVGMILVGLGSAPAAMTWWAWTALAIFTVSCGVQVRIEEAHLEASFGSAYRDFRSTVPRWLGPVGTK